VTVICFFSLAASVISGKLPIKVLKLFEALDPASSKTRGWPLSSLLASKSLATTLTVVDTVVAF